MGKYGGATMAIGHATPKYGNYGKATGKTFLVRMSIVGKCLWEWNTPLGKV